MKKLFLILSLCVLLSGISFAAESGPLAPAPFPTAGKPGPIAKSKMFVTDAAVKDGKASVTIPLDTPRRAMIMVLDEPSVQAFTGDLKMLTPMKIREKELSRMNLPVNNTRFNLDSLTPGKQLLHLHGIRNEGRVKLVISQPDTSMTMMAQVTPLAARSGQNVTISVRLLDEGTPKNVSVRAMLPGLAFINLEDNGTEGDKAANDGIYTATFTAPAVRGFEGVNIRFTAQGQRHDGTPFMRNGLGSVMVTNPKSGISRQSVTVGENSITVPVRAAEGRYRVAAIFGYHNSTLAYSREDVQLDGASASVTLPLPQESLAANRVLIRLLNKDNLGLEDEYELVLTPRQAPPDLSKTNRQAPPLPPSKARAAEKMKEKK